MKIRVSIGTAAALGLEKIKIETMPTTAYLMMYTEKPCLSNCSFCPQARESRGNSNYLSRVFWPTYELGIVNELLKNQKGNFKRVCIQTIRFENANEELIEILRILKENKLKIPISVCCFPVTESIFREMKQLGVSRVGISFDCATSDLFRKHKGKERGVNLTWDDLSDNIQKAIAVFGNGFVSTHLIIGLGETEREAIEFIQKFHDKKINVGLFAFTPIKGTALEKHPKPKLNSYRRMQLARFLIFQKKSTFKKMLFSNELGEKQKIINFGISKEQLLKIIESGKPFKTTGCPFCNRPFYNESPNEVLYNYPRELSREEVLNIKQSLSEFI